MEELIYNLRRLSEWTAKELWENPVNFPEGVLKQAADELEKRRWTPVEERLPEPYETVFVSVSTKNGYDEPVSYETLAAYEHSAGEWVNGITGSPVTVRDYEHVTHWMYLPEAPKEDKV